MDIFHTHAFAKCLSDIQQTIRRPLAERRSQHFARNAFQRRHAIEPVQIGFQTPQSLLHRFLEVPANRHHFADRFHRGCQLWLRAFELLECEAGDLCNNVIDCRLKRCRCSAGDLVGNLVKRVANGQLRRDARNRETGRFGCQSGRTRHARVHLDHDQAAIGWVNSELDVGAAGFDANLAQHLERGGAHNLILLVGQCQRGSDGDRVTSMHAHRIDVLDRADDDAVVMLVAHDLHLILFPSQQRFFDQHFCGG